MTHPPRSLWAEPAAGWTGVLLPFVFVSPCLYSPTVVMKTRAFTPLSYAPSLHPRSFCYVVSTLPLSHCFSCHTSLVHRLQLLLPCVCRVCNASHYQLQLRSCPLLLGIRVEWPRYTKRERKDRCWLGGQLLFF